MKIVDAHSPFFIFAKNDIINWSKLPFSDFENALSINKEQTLKTLYAAYELFLNKIAQLGYSAIALDDIAHFSSAENYDKKLQEKLKLYGEIYTTIIQKATIRNLKVYLRTDIMYTHSHIPKKPKEQLSFFCTQLKKALSKPIAGIIIRIGEADGIDVEGDFKSTLTITSPKMLNTWLKEIMSICDEYEKQCILRTWALGAYKIGDIMWNEKTLRASLRNIDSTNLILSLKPGEADFFRNLPLNPLFEKLKTPFILELQAKREYDGFGVLPYYVGWDYETIISQLAQNPYLKGISVWCQEGGWSSWKSITFLEQSSKWTELNTIACVELYEHYIKNPQQKTLQRNNTKSLTHISIADAIVTKHMTKKILIFLRAYYRITQRLLYARTSDDYYLRRIRIPPLLWLYWDSIIVNKTSRAFIKRMQYEYEPINYDEITLIQTLAKNAELENAEYIADTLRLFWHGREALLDVQHTKELKKFGEMYDAKYPNTYKCTIDEEEPSILMSLILKLAIRSKRPYRIIDRILLSKPMSFLLELYVGAMQKHMPKLANQQGMSLKTFFK
jgi:hypothetical protein